MYVIQREKKDDDVIKEYYITNPRFDIDEARKVKAFIRFKFKTALVEKAEEGMELHDIRTMMKYGRCLSMSVIEDSVYEMSIRVAGKEKDSIYLLRPIFANGFVHLTIVDAFSVDKDLVNI